MNKELLEALKTIKIKCHPNSNPSPLVDEALDIVEQALMRLESIDNANPSEAMECLKRVWNDINNQNDFRQDFKDLTIVENYIIKAQEQEKENAKYKQLENQLGCPLEMILNLMINSNTLDEHCHTQDIYFDYKGKLISGSFIKLEYNNEFVINVETDEMFDSHYDIDDYDLKVKDYKKTWWLKEDLSE